ncbi:hypothetical protein KY349_05100 [Candidatus Woesearchaeota archaeon]|nr:hypothetical protein [Candidatus Woesearchaeota archaeon]
MEPELKESKLISFAESVLNYPDHKQEFEHILKKLDLSEKEVVQAFVDYNMDVYAYENEVYESTAMRVVLHVHNLLKGSWHQDRQDAVLDMLEGLDIKTAVDIGFGVPTKYVINKVLKENKIRLTLVDMYDSAFKFSEVLLDFINKSWRDVISFKKSDMDSNEFVGEFDAYLFQDSIEHTKDPTAYLKKTVGLAPSNAKFILSLPIGPKVPAHHIAWEDNNHAETWLKECGLSIDKSVQVDVNPEIDLFAHSLNGKFHNLIVTCSKSDSI